jgi:signal transduction histidine kinase
MNFPGPNVAVRPIDILLVEDSGVDRMLTAEALREFRVVNALHCVADGEEALDFLRRRGRHAEAPRPDLILLDLNLPRKDGREVLAEIKADPLLKQIPVVVLTTSSAEEDLLDAYGSHANCYITKPIDLEQFGRVTRSLENFWFEIVTLPPRPQFGRGGEAGDRSAADGGPRPGEQHCRVLLVEDSASDALLLESALADSVAMRFSTERVDRLVAAVDRLRAGGIDAVVTDLSLPDSEGVETLRKVCRAAGDTPVIVLTAMDDERRGLELLREGARDCLVKGELGGRALARAIRQAVDRAHVEERLRHAQRMESVGVLAGGVAHDFNNLLTIIRGNAELISEGRLEPGAGAAAARQIITAADRGATLTRQLLTFSRRERMRARPVELNEALREFAKMLRRLLGPTIKLEERLCAEPMRLVADPGMIEQVVMNLAINARDAMPGGGRLTLETSRVELAAAIEGAEPCPPAGPGPYALLAVRDTGAGIPADVLPHVFEPFFTTKETGKGTGLGLATVYGVVRQHRGEVNVRSEPGSGAEFRVWLPIAEAPTAEPAASAAPVEPGGAGGTILLVDDEELVREMAASVLRLQGYEVIEAGDGVEALARWEEAGDRVRLLLTDLLMPEGISGAELARTLLARKPGLRVVYSSGHAGSLHRELHLVEGLNHVAKPYTLEALTRTVRRALQS